jgi:hypothetical protein
MLMLIIAVGLEHLWWGADQSATPCDAARALFLQRISGKLCLSDAGGFSITKQREPWGVLYLYTPHLSC